MAAVKAKQPKLNSGTKNAIEKLDRIFGIEGQNIQVIDESMSLEEKEFALFEEALKEGLSPEDAEEDTRKWVKRIASAESLFN